MNASSWSILWLLTPLTLARPASASGDRGDAYLGTGLCCAASRCAAFLGAAAVRAGVYAQWPAAAAGAACVAASCLALLLPEVGEEDVAEEEKGANAALRA